jgi:Protein of unknown function (DUF433)
MTESTRAMAFTRISVDPRRCGGAPCIRDLRIPVATVVAMAAEGRFESPERKSTHDHLSHPARPRLLQPEQGRALANRCRSSGRRTRAHRSFCSDSPHAVLAWLRTEAAEPIVLLELFGRFSDIGVGSGGTSCSLVRRTAVLCPVLHGLAHASDDRGDVARADIAASAGAQRPDRWYPHEVALDQLQRVQGWEQPRGARETLQPAHRTNA